MAGPVIGGLVVVTGGTVAALLANCGLFAAIALILVTATGLPGAAARAGSRHSDGSARALDHIRRQPRAALAADPQAGGLVMFTISIPVEVVFAQHTLHAGAAGYGALLSGWGTGAVIGSAALRPLAPAHRAGCCSPAAAPRLAAGFALMAAAPTLGVAVRGAAGGGDGQRRLVGRCADGLLQEYTTQALDGTGDEPEPVDRPGGARNRDRARRRDHGAVRSAVGVRGRRAAGSLAFAMTVWIVLRPSVMATAGGRATTRTDGAETNGAAAPAALHGSETLV